MPLLNLAGSLIGPLVIKAKFELNVESAANTGLEESNSNKHVNLDSFEKKSHYQLNNYRTHANLKSYHYLNQDDRLAQ